MWFNRSQADIKMHSDQFSELLSPYKVNIDMVDKIYTLLAKTKTKFFLFMHVIKFKRVTNSLNFHCVI